MKLTPDPQFRRISIRNRRKIVPAGGYSTAMGREWFPSPKKKRHLVKPASSHERAR
jgi:hypothetical protein